MRLGRNWDRIGYSPDGRRLMWDMTAGAMNEVIVLANANGGAPHVIDHGNAESDFQPAFSPNGRQIVYLNNGGFVQTFGTIYLVRADGTDRHRVPTAGNCCKFVPSVVFSPDGKRLAFGLLGNGAAEKLKLSTLPVVGGRPELSYSRATNFNGGFTNSLSWQPVR